MIRLFVAAELKLGVEITPSAEQGHYLASVMRLGNGDEIALFNGRDGEWLARLHLIGKKGCGLTCQTKLRDQPAASELVLIQALVKRKPLETLIEKAVELGVGTVSLALTRRTNADHTNVSRLQAIAIEASEQCERLDCPEIVAPEPLDRVLAKLPDATPVLFCDEQWQAPAIRAPLQSLEGIATGPAAILIGPEGGFTPEERDQLLARTQVTPLWLGPRILRADTAAIAALTLYQAARGDWRRS